jgi:hypothetical protein
MYKRKRPFGVRRKMDMMQELNISSKTLATYCNYPAIFKG